jgi:tricorn protease
VLTDVSIFLLTRDKQKILYQSGDVFGIVNSTGKSQSGDGKLSTGSIEIKINPVLEWKQIFNEAWRINRDYFYDPGMHGADWNSMKLKYETFLPHIASRDDLGKVITWLCSELTVSHSFYGGGDFLYKPQNIKGGLLGADFVIENGRYRVKKIISGINWTPDLRSPLTEPGVDVKEGEYILAVNGKELVPPEDFYSRFENLADKIVELKVGPNPDGTGSRKVKVVPLSNENDMRFRDWVEGNLKKVEEATAGKVAYVYVPNTAQDGYNYFKRYFYPQVDKQAIIIDERFNGGGSIADYYMDILRRPFVSMWAMRYGADLKTPGSSIQGPKVLLINEYAGSGGDLFPWMFRKFGLGKLIGKRTWGGLVGILGFPQLMDGAGVTAPNLAIWTKDGWIVENKGIDPDIEVEQLPVDMLKGGDPQLDKAISVILDELKNNPQEELKRPAYPVRVRKQ